MHRVESFIESKYLGLATVATGCLVAFSASDTTSLKALAISAALMGAYWFIYGDQ